MHTTRFSAVKPTFWVATFSLSMPLSLLDVSPPFLHQSNSLQGARGLLTPGRKGDFRRSCLPFCYVFRVICASSFAYAPASFSDTGHYFLTSSLLHPSHPLSSMETSLFSPHLANVAVFQDSVLLPLPLVPGGNLLTLRR